jgi:hypothetical protein
MAEPIYSYFVSVRCANLALVYCGFRLTACIRLADQCGSHLIWFVSQLVKSSFQANTHAKQGQSVAWAYGSSGCAKDTVGTLHRAD